MLLVRLRTYAPRLAVLHPAKLRAHVDARLLLAGLVLGIGRESGVGGREPLLLGVPAHPGKRLRIQWKHALARADKDIKALNTGGKMCECAVSAARRLSVQVVSFHFRYLQLRERFCCVLKDTSKADCSFTQLCIFVANPCICWDVNLLRRREAAG